MGGDHRMYKDFENCESVKNSECHYSGNSRPIHVMMKHIVSCLLKHVLMNPSLHSERIDLRHVDYT